MDHHLMYVNFMTSKIMDASVHTSIRKATSNTNKGYPFRWSMEYVPHCYTFSFVYSPPFFISKWNLFYLRTRDTQKHRHKLFGTTKKSTILINKVPIITWHRVHSHYSSIDILSRRILGWTTNFSMNCVIYYNV